MNTIIEEWEKELENASLSECLEITARTIQERNTPIGIIMSHETVKSLVALFYAIAQYMKEN